MRASSGKQITWDEFVAGWAGSFDGYDVRYAAAFRRRLLGVTYRTSAVLTRLRIRPASMMLLSAVCSIAVPVLAFRQGAWPAAAALVMLAGLGADTVGFGLTVLYGRATRLSSFYQSLVERTSEVCWLLALAFLGTKPWLIFAISGLVWAHEYLRAAAALRPVAASTVGDRPTRMWLTLVALLLAAASAQIGQDLAAGAVTLIVVIWLALALVGIGQLFGVIRKVLA